MKEILYERANVEIKTLKFQKTKRFTNEEFKNTKTHFVYSFCGGEYSMIAS